MSAVIVVCGFAVSLAALGFILLARDAGVLSPADVPVGRNESEGMVTEEAVNKEEGEGFLNYTFAIYDVEVTR